MTKKTIEGDKGIISYKCEAIQGTKCKVWRGGEGEINGVEMSCTGT